MALLNHKLTKTKLSNLLGVLLGLSCYTTIAHAETPEEAAKRIAIQQMLLQGQKQAQMVEGLSFSPTVHIDLPTQTLADPSVHNEELPCFTINQIVYTPLVHQSSIDLQQFAFALTPFTHGKDKVLGKCLNINDINQIVSGVQNRLIGQGYSTTRVVVGNQNLASGRLLLTIVSGVVGEIKADTSSSRSPVYVDNTGLPANFRSALDLKTGDVLNIRKLETALENLKRVPTADADFSIMPSDNTEIGAGVGYSDIVIKYAQHKKMRFGATLDDSGSKSTGKYQGGLTFSFDNPTFNNDLLYLSYSRDLGDKINRREYADKRAKGGSTNYALGYTLPIHNFLINANAGHYTYHQTVAGANQDYKYSGKSNNISLNTSYLAHRDANSKTWLNVGGFVKAQQNFIDDTEVDVQRRKVSGWTAGFRNETRFGQKQLSTDVSIQRGTGAFNALIPPESLFNEGTIRTPIYKFNLNFATPIKLGDSYQLGYQANLKTQYAQEALVPSERMSIGGRYSVRGFDGERTLSGDMGATFRQDVSFPIKQSNHSLYLGLDAGTVAMSNKEQDNLLLGHTLVGGAIGIKGQIKPLKLNYDLFTGHPIRQPEYFGKKEWTGGVSLGWGF